MSRVGLVLGVLALGGCGFDSSPGGVAVVSGETSASEQVEVVITLPPELTAPSTVPVPPVDVPEVDTVVEPVVVERPASIAVVGDSLTLSARDEILAALEPEGMDIIAVDGMESRRMVRGSSALPSGAAVIEGIRIDHEPELWVIALGTNDVASVGDLVDFRDEMAEVLATIPADVPVVWVDLWIGGRQEMASRANLQIRAELSERERGAAVVDWYSYGDDDGVITGDGVHLTPMGQTLFADAIVAAVDEMFAEP